VPTSGTADPLKPLLRPRDSFVPLVLPSTTLLVQLSVRDVTAVDGGDVDHIMCVEVKGDEFYDEEKRAPRRGGSRSAPAASAAQLESGKDEIVITVDPPHDLLSEESLSSLDEDEELPFGFFPAVLDAINTFIQATPLPWKVSTLAPQLLAFLPNHDRAMIGIALLSYLRGAKATAEIIVRTSAAQPPV